MIEFRLRRRRSNKIPNYIRGGVRKCSGSQSIVTHRWLCQQNAHVVDDVALLCFDIPAQYDTTQVAKERGQRRRDHTENGNGNQHRDQTHTTDFFNYMFFHLVVVGWWW